MAWFHERNVELDAEIESSRAELDQIAQELIDTKAALVGHTSLESMEQDFYRYDELRDSAAEPRSRLDRAFGTKAGLRESLQKFTDS